MLLSTPFTPDLKLDEAALQRQIDYVVRDCRATMIVAAGVETQEYTYLSFEQRRDLIQRTIEFVDERSRLVGISHPSFKTAIELAHDAERLAPPQCNCLRRCGRSPALRRRLTSLPISRR